MFQEWISSSDPSFTSRTFYLTAVSHYVQIKHVKTFFIISSTWIHTDTEWCCYCWRGHIM